MIRLIFPPKCTLCQKVLSKNETDLCHHCRENTESFKIAKSKIPYVAHWTALWYYKENVRKSIQRYKFGRRRHYASVYGRLLAVKLSGVLSQNIEMLSWVPISPVRKLKRGYDQSELICRAVGKELGIPVVRVLKKIRHTPPQSSLQGAARRRANIVGAYKAIQPQAFDDKRILLIDDVVTTGSTVSECAKTLLIAGAKEIHFAAVAASSQNKK